MRHSAGVPVSVVFLFAVAFGSADVEAEPLTASPIEISRIANFDNSPSGSGAAGVLEATRILLAASTGVYVNGLTLEGNAGRNEYEQMYISTVITVNEPGWVYYWGLGESTVWHDGMNHPPNAKCSAAYGFMLGPNLGGTLAALQVVDHPEVAQTTEFRVWDPVHVTHPPYNAGIHLYSSAGVKVNADTVYPHSGDAGAFNTAYFGVYYSPTLLDDPDTQVPDPDRPDPGSIGTLSVSSGPPITDVRLRQMLDDYIPTDDTHSTLIVFGQCYGGSAADDMARDRDNTQVLSATRPGQMAWYKGYHDNAAIALKPGPGRTSSDVREAGVAGKDPRETPQVFGDDVSLEPVTPDGEIKKRVVVVYAGYPDDPKANTTPDRDRIIENFAGEENTVVVTVGGDGAGGWQYPGTQEGLRQALEGIENGGLGPDCQFIMYVTDHGDCHEEVTNVVVDSANPHPNIQPVSPLGGIEVSSELSRAMLSEAANESGVTLYFEGENAPVFSPGDIAVKVYDDFFETFEEYSIDLNGDNDTADVWEGTDLFFPIPDSAFRLSRTEDVMVDISIANYTLQELHIAMVTLDSGGMAPSAAPGDSNGDGKIDGTDLAEWQANYDPLGSNDENNTFAMGDWDRNGRIDGGDLALWQQNYNPIGGSADGGAELVPEPATATVLLLGLAGLLAWRRRTPA